MSHAALNENLSRAHGFEPLRIDGALPEGLRGTLYRTGPGVFERFGKRLPHAFEADAVLSAVRLDGQGGASGAARVLESDGYREEEAAGRHLYSARGPWLRRVVDGLRGRGKNTGNTAIWTWRERVYALLEACPPAQFDADTLEWMGEDRLDDVVVRSFSAHPRRVESLRTWFNFGQRYGRETKLDLYAFPDEGPAKSLGSITCPWPGFVHDFVATEHYLVFVICPAKIDLRRAMFQLGHFVDWFGWYPSEGAEIVVVPLADATDPRKHVRTRVESFWVWHFVNAFERDDEIVIDYCRYPNLDSLAAIGSEQRIAPPLLHRARLDPRTGGWTSEARWSVGCEFPRVRATAAGARHDHAWLLTSTDPDHYGLARVELDEQVHCDRWIPEPHQRPSEPIPVSVGEHTWILSLCHDERARASFVAVLDGAHMDAGPVARLWFDHAIPLTFHGAWVSR